MRTGDAKAHRDAVLGDLERRSELNILLDMVVMIEMGQGLVAEGDGAAHDRDSYREDIIGAFAIEGS